MPERILTRTERRVLTGRHPGLRGDCSNLRGDCSGLRGYCTGLRGDCTGLTGNCTGLTGNLARANLTVADRVAGVDIATLVREAPDA